MRFILFLFLTIRVVFTNPKDNNKPKDFCSDINAIESVFTMGNTTYLLKGKDSPKEVFTKEINEKFKDKTSVDSNTVFKKESFVSINTGFYITTVPKCDIKTFLIPGKCKGIQKLLGMGFIIGYAKDKPKKQSYFAFRYKIIEDQNTIVPIEDNKEMPMDMKPQSVVVFNENFPLFPLSSAETVVYTHSAFDERNYTIVFMIKKTSGLEIDIINLKDLIHTDSHINIKIFPNNQIIRTFIGFFQMGLVSENITTYAIATLGNSDTQIVLEFIPECDKELPRKKEHLIEQKTIELYDIYGCDKPINDTTPDGNGNQTSGTELIPGDDSGPNIPPKVSSIEPTTEGVSKEFLILLTVLVVVFVIGLILFLAMIAIVIHIRRKNKNREKR